MAQPNLTRRAASAVILATLSTCQPPERFGCIGDPSATCQPPSPCEALVFQCPSDTARVFRMSSPSQRLRGLDALGTVGDYVLQNGRVTAVIDDPADAEHRHGIHPSGGTLIDLASADGMVDHLNQISQVVGILPRDALFYDRAETVSEANLAAVIVRGHLAGNGLNGGDRVEVVTRYELRPCDLGVRVRTEIYNAGRRVLSAYLADAMFWGDRGVTPFSPRPRGGFSHPRLQLLNLAASFEDFPWVAAQSHANDSVGDTGYAVVSCVRPNLRGLNDPTLSAAGEPPEIIAPGDGRVFERFVAVARGPGLSAVASLAIESHAQMFNEATTHLAGRVSTPDGRSLGGSERAVSLVFSTRDANGVQTPWNEAVPDALGAFVVTVPTASRYVIQPWRSGRPLGAPIEVTDPAQRVTVSLPSSARVTVRVTDAMTSRGLDAEVIFVPTGPTRPESVRGSLYGFFAHDECAPYLGPPHGASPGCNRALAFQGFVQLPVVPPGTYWVYAQGGPSRTLARQRITVTEGDDLTVNLSLRALPGLFPDGSLSADFHVHGGRSFDASLPDRDRAESFLAAGVEVIAATDHDVCTSYTQAVNDLGGAQRVRVMSGVEMTPLIPYFYVPGESFPKTFGHFNGWPLRYDPALPRNGAPWDETREPGALFDRMRAAMPTRGVIQLNHPVADSKIGRDEGFLRVLGWRPDRGIPAADDGSRLGLLHRTPAGASSANSAFDTVEAMQGAGVLLNILHRDLWHSFLDHGILRAATADSDSHSLQVEPMGYPRNVVSAGMTVATFDADRFNAAVREGRSVGTNGPYIEASIMGDDGQVHRPSVEPFAPAPGAQIALEVRAAPWISVSEVRVFVNGRVLRTITGTELTQPMDPFGTEGVVRFRGTIPVPADDRHPGRDAWVVVEAGGALPRGIDAAGDDGLIDHIDGNDDGRIDLGELDPNGDGRIASDEDPVDRNGDGAIDEGEIGMSPPPEDSAGYQLHVVSPGMISWAFTNALLLDLDGGGWRAPRR